MVRCEKQQKLNWDMFELLIRETVRQSHGRGGGRGRKIFQSCVDIIVRG